MKTSGTTDLAGVHVCWSMTTKISSLIFGVISGWLVGAVVVAARNRTEAFDSPRHGQDGHQ